MRTKTSFTPNSGVKPNWHRRYNTDTGDLHHDDHVAQRFVLVQYDVHDANAWYVT